MEVGASLPPLSAAGEGSGCPIVLSGGWRNDGSDLAGWRLFRGRDNAAA